MEVKAENGACEKTEKPTDAADTQSFSNTNGAGDVKVDIKNVDEKTAQIVKQIEYYFGDVNLPRDKFLMNEVKTKGWVPLSTMLKFNRLAKITEDVEQITKALEKCSTLMEVSESRDSIRRRADRPLPENTLEYWLEVKRRTVYVKGFPQDAIIDELIPFFDKFGGVENVLMRKTKAGNPRVFKGSVFVTFKDVSTAEKFANSEDVLTYTKGGVPLIKLMQEQYWANKNKELKEKKGAHKNIKDSKNAQVAQEQKDSFDAVHYVKGVVLKVSGLPECSFAEVKEFFRKFGNVAFVKIDTKEHEALIRFVSTEENVAQKNWDKALEDNGGKVEFPKGDAKHELTAYVLEGDEESAYWVEFNNSKLQKNDQFRSKNKQKYGSGKKQQRDAKPHYEKAKGGATAKTEMEVDAAGSRKRPQGEDTNGGAAAEKKPRRIVFEDEEGNGDVKTAALIVENVETKKEAEKPVE